jgi:hypothetical protein
MPSFLNLKNFNSAPINIESTGAVSIRCMGDFGAGEVRILMRSVDGEFYALDKLTFTKNTMVAVELHPDDAIQIQAYNCNDVSVQVIL